MTTPSDILRPEPRWPALLAAFAAVALHFVLPTEMRIGPPWVLASTVAVLVVAAAVTRRLGKSHANSMIGYAILLVLTGGLVFGVASLIFTLIVTHKASAREVLGSATVLWATNVIVFASWYWRLDAGGPNARERRDAHTEGAFLFPQMTFPAAGGAEQTIAEEEGWRPHFVDYLFVAFNTSTAFSPTDAPVLSKWAKVAMMLQAIISFTTVVLVAARAVNVLPTN